jgi:hypothetical protein
LKIACAPSFRSPQLGPEKPPSGVVAVTCASVLEKDASVEDGAGSEAEAGEDLALEATLHVGTLLPFEQVSARRWVSRRVD